MSGSVLPADEVTRADVQDVNVLAVILFFWLLIFFFYSQLINVDVVEKAGMMVNRLDLMRAASGRTKLHEYDSTGSSHGRSLFLFDRLGDPSVRDYGSFCKGVSPPPAPCGTFQLVYSTTRRWHMYRLLAKGCLRRCALFVFACGVLAMTLSWSIRNAAFFHHLLRSTWFSQSNVEGNMKAAASIQAVLLPLGSFTLGLYVKAKLNWFDNIITLMWRMQGKIADVSLIAGSSLLPANAREVVAAKYRLYRYLNVAHYLLYRNLAVEYSGDKLSDLTACSLLTTEEVTILENTAHPRPTVLVWIGHTLRQLSETGRMNGDMLPRAIQVLREVQATGDEISNELTRLTPISLAQLMQLIVDMLMFLTPPSLAFMLTTDREGWSVYVWPMLGSMLLAMMYQGGMQLVSALEYPLGSDLDDVHPDYLLLATERATHGFLNDNLPQQLVGLSLAEQPDDDKVDDIPDDMDVASLNLE